MKIYVETDSDTCLGRRVIRDMEHRGRALEGILAQYEKVRGGEKGGERGREREKREKDKKGKGKKEGGERKKGERERESNFGCDNFFLIIYFYLFVLFFSLLNPVMTPM